MLLWQYFESLHEGGTQMFRHSNKKLVSVCFRWILFYLGHWIQNGAMLICHSSQMWSPMSCAIGQLLLCPHHNTWISFFAYQNCYEMRFCYKWNTMLSHDTLQNMNISPWQFPGNHLCEGVYRFTYTHSLLCINTLNLCSIQAQQTHHQLRLKDAKVYQNRHFREICGGFVALPR